MSNETILEPEISIAQLKAALDQRSGELAVINSVQEALSKKMDIQSIYDLVGDRIRDLFNAQVVAISTFNLEEQTEKFEYMVEKGERYFADPRPLGKLRLALVKSKKKIIINTSKEGVEWFGSEVVPGTEPIKSAVFVPMVIADKITGYITLQNVDNENAFSDADINLLETLANSMAVALENARLFDETNRLLKETEQGKAELAVINSVQEGLVREMDIQGIYNLIGNRIRELFNAQVVLIASFDYDKKMEHFNYHIEKGEISHPAPRPYDKVRQHLIQTGQNILINENFTKAAAEFGMKVLPGTEMPKSLLFMPMKVGDKVTGYVSLQNIDQENAFSFSDVRLLSTLANSMSVALQNAKLFDETNRLLKETEQQKGELAVINSVQDGLAKALDMQAIYDLVGNRIRDLFDAQVVGIATFDHDDETEHIHYLLEKGERYYPAPRPLNMLRKHLIQTKEKVLINTNFEVVVAAFGLKPVSGTQSPKSALFVPLVIGDKVTGYVSLQNLDKENAFSDSDVRLLETLANTMGVALENARLFDETTRLLKETEQQKAELGVINSVQEGLAKELDMQTIYDLVGERIRELFNAQAVTIVNFNHETATEHFKYVIENGQRFYLAPRPYDKLRQHLIVSKEKILINSNFEEAYAKFGLKTLPGTNPTKSAVFVPLIIGDKVNSYISLQNLEVENAFSGSDVRLLETLANSMSVALENARLFDETNRLLKETEQRTAELAVINSVQEGLAHELDMKGIYNLVGDRVQKLFNAQSVIIASFDHQNKMEYFHYQFEKGEVFSSKPRPLNALRQKLIEQRHTLYIETEERGVKEFGITPIEGTEMPKSLLFVPLMAGSEMRGYVSLQNIDKENAFSESDVRLLETLANSMSVALENARLFDETNRLLKETEQRTAELAVINGVQEGLAHELDMQGIYNLVGDRVQKLFHTHAVIIATLDLANDLEHFNYAFENGERFTFEPRPINTLRKILIERKQTIYIETEKSAREEYGITAIEETKMPKSLMFVPLLSGSNIKGYVSIQNVDEEHAFNQSDIRLLETLANSMSVALENARLFDETARLLSEAKQRATELSTVNNVSKALASQLDPDELIQLVGEQIKNLFSANIAYLALLNPKTQMINFAYQYGEVMPSRIIGEGLTSKIILTGEPLLINEDLDEKTEEMGIQRMGASAASYLGVPIPVGEEIVGVISVQSTEQENRFNENDQRLLSTIAASVGVALNNATLFEDVKQAKMEAEAASKAAEKANEAKSAFLSTVSHELRTPLTSVLGFAKIIRKRLDEKIFPLVNRTEPKTEKVVNQINENLKVVISEGERLTHLINDVLDLAKIEAGKMEWNVEDVSMADVAERAIAATTSLFDQKSLQLEKKIENDLPAVSGDKDKLIQVIINLISNSVKFTDEGSVTCKVFKKKNELIVSISDTGIGIAPEDHAAVFEQFKQVGGDTLTDKPKGTGLGLPICKEIVEHHGGRIWLESKPGKGSTFSFALPINKAEPEPKPVHLDKLLKQLKEQMAQSALNTSGKSTILIVDDEESIRSLLHQELSEAGYLIEEAKNGKEALERVRKNKPDLIILDIMMPEMNGFDVAAVLKNDPQTLDIPIIVLSIVQDKIRGFRIGVDRYLTKPIDTAQLFTEVGTLLEQGKSKKKVMVVDEDSAAVSSLTQVLETKGYNVVQSDGKELVDKAISDQPDIIILNSVHSDKQEVIQTLRFEKGLENVLFLIYG